VRKINAVGDLAQLLGTSRDRLQDIARFKDDLYRPFTRHRRGVSRTIDCPIDPLRAIQRRIYKLLLRDYKFQGCVHGGVPGRSIFTAVVPHARQLIVVTVDLKKFYPSIDQSAVYDVWRRQLGHGRDVAKLLTDLSSWRGCLPHGAPTSMALANLVMAPADLQIELQLSLLGRGIKYTRWVDDIIVSGTLVDPQAVFDIVAHAVTPLGLKLHRKDKRRVMWRSHHRQLALGLDLNDGVKVPRATRKRLRAAVYTYARYRRGSYENIVGRLEFASTTHAALAARLLVSLKKVANTANRRRRGAKRRPKRGVPPARLTDS
jgi:RNA-directed DNA polymerase